jgi:hypothetical protein
VYLLLELASDATQHLTNTNASDTIGSAGLYNSSAKAACTAAWIQSRELFGFGIHLQLDAFQVT